jgi:hypothetical protein
MDGVLGTFSIIAPTGGDLLRETQLQTRLEIQAGKDEVMEARWRVRGESVHDGKWWKKMIVWVNSATYGPSLQFAHAAAACGSMCTACSARMRGWLHGYENRTFVFGGVWVV